MKDFSASRIFEEKGHDDENYVHQEVKPIQPFEKAEETVDEKKPKAPKKDIYKSIYIIEKKIGDKAESASSKIKNAFSNLKKRIYDFASAKAEEKAAKKKELKEEKNKISDVKTEKVKQTEIPKQVETAVNKTEEVITPVTTSETETIKENVTENKPHKKLSIVRLITYTVVTLLIFALFFTFLIKQNSYVYLSHDDYGYATLSYVYWEDGMWGQNFSLEQLTHYLTEHYNRWGGRILGFAQEIILLQQSTDAMRFYNAFAVFATFVLAIFIAQKGKKSMLFPVTALFACSLFGFLGENASIGGMYWYTASILYTIPVVYIFAGTLMLYTMLFGENDRKFAVSKILMIPFCTVLFIFGAFSMEQVGIAAVMIVASMTVYSTFKDRNPLKLIYAIPPLLGSIAGYHILLVAIGNASRKKMYADYYSLPFIKQMLTSGKNIADSLFNNGNLAFVILIAVVTSVCALYLIKKRKKNVFYKTLLGIDVVLGSFSVGAAYIGLKTPLSATIMWIYLVFMALTVSIWLFSSGKVGDFVIWSVFFGGLVSQAACLISPVYHESCFIIFFMAFAVVSIRLFNQLISEIKKEKLAVTLCLAMIPIFTVGAVNAGKIYFGFKSNVRVQEYNEAMIKFVAEQYEEGIVTTKINLMKLKNERYTGSTMPYKRDLIKDWMKIYYKLPDNLQYTDFVYEEYDELRLTELEEQLEKNRYNFENGITEEPEIDEIEEIDIIPINGPIKRIDVPLTLR